MEGKKNREGGEKENGAEMKRDNEIPFVEIEHRATRVRQREILRNDERNLIVDVCPVAY